MTGVEFNMYYSKSFEGLQVNFLTLLMVIANIPGECVVSVDGAIFHRYENASSDMCSLEDPSLVLNNVRSNIECVLLCQGDPRCSGVNWKEPNVCEMYFNQSSKYGRTPSCSYFTTGEHSNLTIFLHKFIIINPQRILGPMWTA